MSSYDETENLFRLHFGTERLPNCCVGKKFESCICYYFRDRCSERLIGPMIIPNIVRNGKIQCTQTPNVVIVQYAHYAITKIYASRVKLFNGNFTVYTF